MQGEVIQEDILAWSSEVSRCFVFCWHSYEDAEVGEVFDSSGHFSLGYSQEVRQRGLCYDAEQVFFVPMTQDGGCE